MLFNSITFIIFLPIVFVLYWFVIHKRLDRQNLLILVASYVFYGWWDWRFLGLIFISSLADFIIGQKIDNATNLKKRKNYLISSIILNLGLLCFFKYYNFFVDSFIELFNVFGITLQKGTLEILLPVGISFYTFQTLSYSIDIYKGNLKATKNPIAFFAFVSFFPQLVAGPIERAKDLLPQFLTKRQFSYDFAISGLRLILWGLFKKVVIADNLAKYVDIVFSSPEDYYGISVIIATVCFTFQIYCDFSGYSDIAIGVSKLFGFKLMTNFRTPLFSSSIKELWGRWHISLSSWFRDYLYIPLGGNKVGKWRWSFNIFLTFLISGLWHGANWTFVIWGSLNGIYLIVESFTQKQRNQLYQFIKLTHFPSLLKVIQIVITFCLFAFSFMIFRAETTKDAFLLINHLPQKLFTQLSSLEGFLVPFQSIFSSTKEFSYLFSSFVLFFVIDIFIRKNGIDYTLKNISPFFRLLIYYFIIGWLLFFGAFGEPQEFIYFQF